MSYIYNRAQLRDRVRTEGHLKSDSGATEDTRLNAILNYSLAHVWETLTATDQGFDVVRLEKTVDAADLDGWLPDATAVPLPANFRRLVELKRGTGWPDLVSHSESTWRTPSAPPGWYLIDGPGQTIDELTGALVLLPQTIQFSPSLLAGEQITMLYTRQPPSLGDPNLLVAVDPTADDVVVDLIGDGIARMVIARSLILISAKDDQEGRQRAQQEYQLALSEYSNARSQRSGGILSLSRFKKPRPGIRR